MNCPKLGSTTEIVPSICSGCEQRALLGGWCLKNQPPQWTIPIQILPTNGSSVFNHTFWVGVSQSDLTDRNNTFSVYIYIFINIYIIIYIYFYVYIYIDRDSSIITQFYPNKMQFDRNLNLSLHMSHRHTCSSY